LAAMLETHHGLYNGILEQRKTIHEREGRSVRHKD
jgi:hypothetical protein